MNAINLSKLIDGSNLIDDKIVYGLKHNLTLVRKTDDDAIFRGAAAGAGQVSLDKIS